MHMFFLKLLTPTKDLVGFEVNAFQPNSCWCSKAHLIFSTAFSLMGGHREGIHMSEGRVYPWAPCEHSWVRCHAKGHLSSAPKVLGRQNTLYSLAHMSSTEKLSHWSTEDEENVVPQQVFWHLIMCTCLVSETWCYKYVLLLKTMHFLENGQEYRESGHFSHLYHFWWKAGTEWDLWLTFIKVSHFIPASDQVQYKFFFQKSLLIPDRQYTTQWCILDIYILYFY